MVKLTGPVVFIRTTIDGQYQAFPHHAGSKIRAGLVALDMSENQRRIQCAIARWQNLATASVTGLINHCRFTGGAGHQMGVDAVDLDFGAAGRWLFL